MRRPERFFSEVDIRMVNRKLKNGNEIKIVKYPNRFQFVFYRRDGHRMIPTSLSLSEEAATALPDGIQRVLAPI